MLLQPILAPNAEIREERTVTAVVERAVGVYLAANDIRSGDRSGSRKRRAQNRCEEVVVARDDFGREDANEDDDTNVTNIVLVVPTVTGGYYCYTYNALMIIPRSVLDNLTTCYLQLPPSSIIKKEVQVKRMLRTRRARAANPEATKSGSHVRVVMKLDAVQKKKAFAQKRESPRVKSRTCARDIHQI